MDITRNRRGPDHALQVRPVTCRSRREAPAAHPRAPSRPPSPEIRFTAPSPGALDEIAGIAHVAVMQNEPALAHMGVLVEVIDALRVEKRGTTLDAMHLVVLAQKEFGKIGAVLSGDSRDKRALHGGHSVFVQMVFTSRKPEASRLRQGFPALAAKAAAFPREITASRPRPFFPGALADHIARTTTVPATGKHGRKVAGLPSRGGTHAI